MNVIKINKNTFVIPMLWDMKIIIAFLLFAIHYTHTIMSKTLRKK